MMTDFQRDAESRFAGTRFNLRPVTEDPTYPKDGDTWFRVDQGLIKTMLGGTIYSLALLDNTTGQIVTSQLPPITITDTFVVGSQVEMLALTAERGDLAIRTDTANVYILRGANASNFADWQILTSISATVSSVNGQVGVVLLDTDDIAEGSTNLYYTDARFDTRLATKSTTNLSEGINLYYTDTRFDTRLATKTTTNLTEGLNLYYTTARFNTAFSGKSTTDLIEGTNLYYTTARFDTAFSAKSTSDLAEGSNLYYTTARFDTRLATKTTTNLIEGANLYYTTFRANNDFDTRLATKSTTNLAEGTNLYYTNTRADARIAVQKGAVNGLATLDGTGKIPSSQLPGEATLDIFLVADQAAMQALTAQKGDHAKRSDTQEIYVLRAIPASTLSNWELIVADYNANVTSVNGYTDTVSLTTSDISEGTNLYYTDTRFDTRLATKSTTNLSEGTNLYYTTARANTDFDTRLAIKTTTSLSEGTNLYYTTARANTDFDTRLATKTTSDLAEGSNLYYTTARFNTAFSGKSTSDLSEGTNLYYTTARFDTRLSTKTTTDLAEGTNLYYTNSRADARITLQKGAVNGLATLDAGGKIPTSQLPALAITDTFVVVSQVAMLALTAQTGDVAVRTDLNKSFILAGVNPALLADWQELLTPTDAVLSVNGLTGTVVLTTTNISEGTNLYYTDARVRANRLDQMTAPTVDLSINSHKLTNVLNPTAAQDAATKIYVDSGKNTMATPTQIAANTNDYNPGTGRVFRLTSDVNNRQLTGLSVSQVDGTEILLINANATNLNIVLVNESASSTAVNRFTNSSAANLTLGQFGSVRYIYDGTSQRWRDISFR